jgi:hypothetical protein
LSLPNDTLLELMSLADGELEGEAKAHAEALVASSDEARRVVEAIRSPQIGEWLRDATTKRAVQAGIDGTADAVMAKLGVLSGEGGVVRLAGSRDRRGSRVQLVVAAAGAALALAAGIVFLVRSEATRSDQRMPVASVGMPAVDLEPPAMAQKTPAQGVEVDEIDAPSRGISVFEIPAAGAAAAAVSRPSSVVIWIEDDPGAK